MALGLKKLGKDSRVFVVAGDGELNEGLCWEAFMAHRTSVGQSCDHQTGTCCSSAAAEDLMKLGDLKAKMTSFGFADEIDGHDISDRLYARQDVSRFAHCIIANTIKGKGVSYMENDPSWHGRIPKGDEIAQAYKELGGIRHG